MPTENITSNGTPYRANSYPGQCVNCHQSVAAGQGRLEWVDSHWLVRHIQRRSTQECIVFDHGSQTWVVPLAFSTPLEPTFTLPEGTITFRNPVTLQVDDLERPAAATNLDYNSSSIDLRELPRPSRDSLMILSSDRQVFFKVWRGGHSGNTNVYWASTVHGVTGRYGILIGYQRAGDETMTWQSSANAAVRLAFAACVDNPTQALERFGVATGRCGHCGRRLTDPTSVARGIGPVCFGRTQSTRWGAGAPRSTDSFVSAGAGAVTNAAPISWTPAPYTAPITSPTQLQLDELGQGEVR